MSDSSEASPEARSRVALSTILRWLAIALGIMSAVALGRDGLNVTLNEYLDAVVEAYDDTFKDIALLLFEPFILAIFAWVRDLFGWDLHLYAHWKHVFVLLWLYFASSVRNVALTTRAAVFLRGWSAVCALLAGALAGSASLSSPAVFWWSMMGFLLHSAGGTAWVASLDASTKQGLQYFRARGLANLWLGGACAVAAYFADTTPILAWPFVFWWPAAAFVFQSLLRYVASPGDIRFGIHNIVHFAIYGILATGIVSVANSMIEQSLSPGLVALALFVGIEGLMELFLGLLLVGAAQIGSADMRSWGAEHRNVGLDILAVLGGSAFIVWLGNALA